MFWKKKKQEEMSSLPDLPLEPISPELTEQYDEPQYDNQEEQTEIHTLPSFPDSPMKRGFSQSMIKNAIETEQTEEENLPLLPAFNQNQMQQSQRTIEMEEWAPKQFAMPRKQQTEGKSIFIRIDKFQEARESLASIREKLLEMDEILKEIKEVKIKEDQEIMQWEKEITTIRARINGISSDIFESYS